MKLSKQFISLFQDDPKLDSSELGQKLSERAFEKAMDMVNKTLNIR